MIQMQRLLSTIRWHATARAERSQLSLMWSAHNFHLHIKSHFLKVMQIIACTTCVSKMVSAATQMGDWMVGWLNLGPGKVTQVSTEGSTFQTRHEYANKEMNVWGKMCGECVKHKSLSITRSSEWSWWVRPPHNMGVPVTPSHTVPLKIL